MGSKRYNTWNSHLRKLFGEKVVKISLDAGLTCPNRDAQGRGGCIYCSPRGSGDCAGESHLDIADQFAQVRQKLVRKWPGVRKFIAYFQAYTNTFAPVSQLESLYRQALAQPGVVGLSISTRPDCLPAEVLDLLARLNRETYLWVELGLQSAHDSTLARINRGHDYRCFEQAVWQLAQRGIRICTHVIVGLPGENQEMMLQTARQIATLPIKGIKIHALLVIGGTRLAEMWRRGEIDLQDRATYIRRVVDILEVLPRDMVVQRVTGDAPAAILLAPGWARDKWQVLQGIDVEMERRDTWQGCKYQ